jgi:hypothetical protein
LKKINILEGQIDLFNLPIQETKEKRTEKLFIKEDNFNEIINIYKKNCIRIVKQVCGALLVEIEDRTLYFNKNGVNELELKKDMELLPGDEILVVNQDREVNEIQLEKLKGMNVKEYIKRKGDANIIIEMPDRTIVINPRGWILEYSQEPNFKENEVVILENSKKMPEEYLVVGDLVEFIYDKQKKSGIVKSIYNNGETANVSWDNKRAPFYHKCLKKIS